MKTSEKKATEVVKNEMLVKKLTKKQFGEQIKKETKIFKDLFKEEQVNPFKLIRTMSRHQRELGSEITLKRDFKAWEGNPFGLVGFFNNSDLFKYALTERFNYSLLIDAVELHTTLKMWNLDEDIKEQSEISTLFNEKIKTYKENRNEEERNKFLLFVYELTSTKVNKAGKKQIENITSNKVKNLFKYEGLTTLFTIYKNSPIGKENRRIIRETLEQIANEFFNTKAKLTQLQLTTLLNFCTDYQARQILAKVETVESVNGEVIATELFNKYVVTSQSEVLNVETIANENLTEPTETTTVTTNEPETVNA